MLELAQLAAQLVTEASSGARASARLSEAIARESLSPASAEALQRLVYGALRRGERVRAALRELGRRADDAADPLLVVVGAALLDRGVDVAEAVELAVDVAWERFAVADARALGKVSGAARVALLGSLPAWLAECLVSEYGEQAEALAASLAEPAPRSLRVNALVTDVTGALEQLTLEGARVSRGRWGQRALTLEGAFNPFLTRAFHEGVFELQDEASQIACELVAPPPRGLVVDACAGAGGKTLSVAAALGGRGKVLSLDVDEGKLAELRRRAKRAKAANVQPIPIEPSGPLPANVEACAGKVERLLIDAPCSGTGVLRRNPETRARLTPEAIDRLAAMQHEIVERMLPLLAPGGRLVFATCSLLRAEGEALMDRVEAEHAELEPVNLAEIYDRAYVERFVRPAPHRLRLLPHLHGTDGFFVCCLRKRR